MVDEIGKETGARIAAGVHGGDDHHAVALGLLEGLADVGVIDAAVATARGCNERHEVDIGFTIERDHLGQMPAPDRDIDQTCFAVFGVDRAQRAALEIGVDQQHMPCRRRDRGERECDDRRFVLIIGGDDENTRIACRRARAHLVVDAADFPGER